MHSTAGSERLPWPKASGERALGAADCVLLIRAINFPRCVISWCWLQASSGPGRPELPLDVDAKDSHHQMTLASAEVILAALF
jgi:hypothetical protein